MTPRLKFGAFELDVPAHELRKAGIRLRVPDQSVEILAMLVEHPGEVVPREVIRERLWPNGTVVEFEHSVSAAMNRLRSALGDSADAPKYIETLPKRGYRFLGEVEVLEPPPGAAHYRILGEAGRGAMGVVYRAEDVRLGRTVALKLLPEEMSSDAAALERLSREARLLAGLSHPGICTLYGIDEHEGKPCLVMEYLEGVTLRQMLKGARPLPTPQLLDIATQAASALQAAHACGVVHGDLKPGNLLVTATGQVKLMDFGIARRAGELATHVGGTPGYMAPEQAEGKAVDARSDVYSFGAVLHEMATGRSPTEGREGAAFGPEVPRRLVQVVQRCLATDPLDRYQLMSEVGGDLRTLADGVPRRFRSSSRQGGWRWVKTWWIAGVSIFAILAAFVIGWLTRTGKPGEPVPVPVPLTSYMGAVATPSFSPDGDHLAFSWTGVKGDNWDIYVKLIGEDQPQRLTTDPAEDLWPAWSPDGKWITFSRTGSDEKSGVFRVPSVGGAEHKIADVRFPRKIAYHPSGRWFVVPGKDSEQEPLRLFSVTVEDGTKRALTFPPRGIVGDRGPALSPDGRTLLFSRSPRDEISDLYLLRLTGDLRPVEEPARITFLNGCTDEPAWWPDGREILFESGDVCHSLALWRMAVDGRTGRAGEPKRMPFGADSHWLNPAISRQGRIAYRDIRLSSYLWHLDLGSGRPAEILPVSSTRIDSLPQYSPDGSRIVFSSNRSGRFEIWVSNADGSNAVRLTSFGGPYVTSPVWSPDRRRIAFEARPHGIGGIYMIGASGGKPVLVSETEQKRNGLSSWSRDGKWLYFVSGRSGKDQVWKIPAAGGEAIQVTRRGGDYAVESPDGKFVYYLGSFGEGDSSGIWRVPVEGGEEVRIIDSAAAHQFAVVERGIYFFSSWENPAVQCYNFATRKVETVGRVEGSMAWGFTLSPDNRHLVYTVFPPNSPNLMLVDNFR